MTQTFAIDSSKDGQIKSITVYNGGRAEICRNFEVVLHEGDNEIKISNLSSFIVHQSVRVSGLGPAVRLVDVSSTVESGNPFIPRAHLSSLLQKKQTLEAEKLIRQQETDIYLSYAQKMSSADVPVDQFPVFMQMFVQQRTSILRAIVALEEQIKSVDENIAKENNNKLTTSADGQVTVQLFVGPGTLKRPGSSGSQPDEPDEDWKQSVRNEIEVQLAPDINALQQALATKLSAQETGPAERERLEQQHDELMKEWISLAKLKYDEKLKSEIARRADQVQQDPELTTTLTLTYIVSNASWKPVYDVHAVVQDDGSGSAVKMRYRAAVTQSTGEDWMNAPLILSTASDAVRSVTIPRLPTYRIKPRTPLFSGPGIPAQPPVMLAQTAVNGNQPANVHPQAGSLFGAFPAQHASVQPNVLFGQQPANSKAHTTPAFQSAFGASQPTGFSNAGAFGTTAAANSTFTTAMPPVNIAAQEPSLVQYNQIQTIAPREREREKGRDEAQDAASTIPLSEGPTRTLHTSPLSLSYAVSHPVKIPSDGAAHTVTVATIDLEAAISRICIPRIQAAVYLQCRVLNKSDYRFLAGSVNVFLNDTYVSQSSIKDVMPNESFECTLGVDPALRVTYERLLSETNAHQSMFSEQKKITNHIVRIYITNSHTYGVRNLLVRDALPVVSTSDNVKVLLKKPQGLAESSSNEKVKAGEGITARWSSLGGEANGKYEWLVNVDGGKGCTLETEWEVHMPTTHSWDEVVR